MSDHILVVDDEKPIADILQFNLEKEGYQVSCAFDGEDAVQKAKKVQPDLIILDIMLPKKDGLVVCKEIRQQWNVPIIMLTAKDEEVDKVIGLELGADDYVTKPFGTRELLARVKVHLRRFRELGAQQDHIAQTSSVHIGQMTIDPDAYTVYKEQQFVDLTSREFELLYYLARNKGRVFTREQLLQKVWGYDYFGDLRTVDVNVRRLREKIEPDPSEPTYIVTKRGVGYQLIDPADQGMGL